MSDATPEPVPDPASGPRAAATGEADRLEAELHRLFHDPRLEIPPAAGAPVAVLAGARRRRRRREAAILGTGSVAAAAVLVVGLLLPGQADRGPELTIAAPGLTRTVTVSSTVTVTMPAPEVGSPRAQLPPADSTGPAPSSTAAPREEPLPKDSARAPEAAEPVEADPFGDQPLAAPAEIGPSGYGELALGMSFAEVAERGWLADPDAQPPAEGCASYALAEGEQTVREIHISSTHGVAVITASGGGTPEGIALGSPLADAQRAYPDLADDGWGYRAAAGQGAHYRIRVDESEVVSELHLVRDEQDCGTF